MNRLVLALLCALVSIAPIGATEAHGVKITVDRVDGTAHVRAVNASLGDLIQLASLRSGVFVAGSVPHRLVTFEIRDVPVNDLVSRIARESGLILVEHRGAWQLVDPREASVSLDVVDAGAEEIVRSLALQCGIRNVMIDKGVSAKGTFILRSVPCSTAIPLVFETLGIGGELHPNSVLRVRGQR